jgi:hypothetical protein
MVQTQSQKQDDAEVTKQATLALPRLMDVPPPMPGSPEPDANDDDGAAAREEGTTSPCLLYTGRFTCLNDAGCTRGLFHGGRGGRCSTHQGHTFKVTYFSPETGDLHGWSRQDRLTANGRKYTMFVSPSGGFFDSKRKALQSIGALAPPKSTASGHGRKRKGGSDDTDPESEEEEEDFEDEDDGEGKEKNEMSEEEEDDDDDDDDE